MCSPSKPYCWTCSLTYRRLLVRQHLLFSSPFSTYGNCQAPVSFWFCLLKEKKKRNSFSPIAHGKSLSQPVFFTEQTQSQVDGARLHSVEIHVQISASGIQTCFNHLLSEGCATSGWLRHHLKARYWFMSSHTQNDTEPKAKRSECAWATSWLELLLAYWPILVWISSWSTSQKLKILQADLQMNKTFWYLLRLETRLIRHVNTQCLHL